MLEEIQDWDFCGTGVFKREKRFGSWGRSDLKVV
jgi:hypothetical protein